MIPKFQPDITLMPGKVELVAGAPGTDGEAGAIHVDNLDAAPVPWTRFQQSTANPE